MNKSEYFSLSAFIISKARWRNELILFNLNAGAGPAHHANPHHHEHRHK